MIFQHVTDDPTARDVRCEATCGWKSENGPQLDKEIPSFWCRASINWFPVLLSLDCVFQCFPVYVTTSPVVFKSLQHFARQLGICHFNFAVDRKAPRIAQIYIHIPSWRQYPLCWIFLFEVFLEDHVSKWRSDMSLFAGFSHLIGGIPTPLKNMSSSVRVMKFQICGK
jgi:hypothetical protein